VGNPGGEPPGAPVGRQTERKTQENGFPGIGIQFRVI